MTILKYNFTGSACNSAIRGLNLSVEKVYNKSEAVFHIL